MTAPTFPFGETVTLVSRALSGVDGDGNDVYVDVETTLTNIPVWPADGNGTSGNERLGNRDTVISGYAAMLPPGTDVAAVDQVRVYGRTFDVNGEPGFLRSPFTGFTPGVVVALSRVEG